VNQQTTWIVQRAVLALILMVSFYALALGLAAVLLWIPYAAFVNDVRIPAKLALVCIACGLMIIWAVLPRWDKFVAPGPELTASNEPTLFKTLNEVARATNQQMPAEVYLVNEVNAFVAQRGGVMGLGSRRVMGLGLPLMQAVTVQELKAVLAHEFGHYHAGDVKIGPWIYKTRAAIGRAIDQFEEGFLQKLFIWYGNMFLRVTHAVSRRQEFIADEVAANAAGAEPMASALRKTHGAAVAFHGYWNSEVGPVLNSGHLPPLTAGFARFMQTDRVNAVVHRAIATEEMEGRTDPYDTHPPLRERVAALASCRQGDAGDTRPAISLLLNAVSWERRLLATSIGEEWARSLKPLSWDNVIDVVYVPLWRGTVQEHKEALRHATPSVLPFAGALTGAATRGEYREADQAVMQQVSLISNALSLALYERGWAVVTNPGEEIVVRSGAHEFAPFVELRAVAEGRTTPAAWSARCLEWGIGEVPLGAAAPVAAA
jgi:Zn-dependent protease with chaperone function